MNLLFWILVAMAVGGGTTPDDDDKQTWLAHYSYGPYQWLGPWWVLRAELVKQGMEDAARQIDNLGAGGHITWGDRTVTRGA